MSAEKWGQVSHVLDYIMAQQPTKAIKESPGVTAVREEALKPQRKPKKAKEQPPEQLRMF